MTIQEVVDRILDYHPTLKGINGCDNFKCGNPNDVCTGIITAMSPTMNVIRHAVALHANLIVVHEPTNYTSADQPGWHEDFSNHILDEKMALLRDHGIAVWRDHDHMHAHQPDGIFTGVLKYLGWEPYATTDSSMKPFCHFLVHLPQPQTLRAIMRQLKETIGLHGVRYIGREDMSISMLAIVGHLYPFPYPECNSNGSQKEYSVEIIRYFEEQDIQLILPGETIDWTVLSYVRDAVQLGENKAAIMLGHYNWEELGMRYAQEWLQDLVGKGLPVTYVTSEDMYQYYL